MKMLPPVTSSSPAMQRRAVDLPQPEGPTMTMKGAVRDFDVDALQYLIFIESLFYVS